jgi:rhodanese-related sulfurtransferase
MGPGTLPRLTPSPPWLNPDLKMKQGENLYLPDRFPALMVVQLTPEAVAERLRSRPNDMLLLDVREPDEREAAVILPSLHIPMNDVADRKGEIPTDREIVVYCHTGTRSAMVAGYLEGEGFRRVANLQGGIDAWSRKVDPSVPQY